MLPMAIHAAETDGEVDLLTNGTGELKSLLDTYSLLPPNWQPPGVRPISYLRDLGVLDAHPLLIHCNCIDEADAGAIARAGCTVCKCPRSNAFFRRTDGSLQRLLDAGVCVALGTDSLASNDTLSMLDEMQFFKRQHPELHWETIFDMATANGARALDMPHGGVLAGGLPADITAIRPAPNDDPMEGVLQKGAAVLMTMSSGRVLYSAPGVAQPAPAVPLGERM